MRNLLYLIIFFLVAGEIPASESLKFRLSLRDKQGSIYQIEKPKEFLSEKALKRKETRGISIDSTDLPVSAVYKKQIESCGAIQVTASKWLNTIVVSAKDSSVLPSLAALPFISKIELVWKGKTERDDFFIDVTTKAKPTKKSANSIYGDADFQMRLHKGQLLHQAGFQGEGMTIAVIDAGFLNVDRNTAFQKAKIIGTRDFVENRLDFYDSHSHGALVLSAMAGEVDGAFKGTAPNADYWLLRSEDNQSEYPVEEDYWAAAIEFADSVGADVVNSSLGYAQFDDTALNYTHNDLDGRTAFITRAASLGARKGLLIVNSAGNERIKEWNKILFPGDANDILTVGGVDRNMQPSTFTSVGYTVDRRVKPDVVSLGTNTALISIEGSPTVSNGTSFATPVITGLAACLWQALPHLSNKEIIDLIRTNSAKYTTPDSIGGYGAPDIYKAYQQGLNSVQPSDWKDISLNLFYNEETDMLVLKNLPWNGLEYMVQIFSSTGRLLKKGLYTGENNAISLLSFPKGIYIINIQGENLVLSRKFIKK